MFSKNFVIQRKYVYIQSKDIVSYELQVGDFKKTNLRVVSFILRVAKNFLGVGNKITSCKLLLASCELLFMSCKFKEILLRIASCVLWVEN